MEIRACQSLGQNHHTDLPTLFSFVLDITFFRVHVSKLISLFVAFIAEGKGYISLYAC